MKLCLVVLLAVVVTIEAVPSCPSAIFSFCAQGPPSGVDLCNSDADCTGTETCCTLCGNRKCEGPSLFNPPILPVKPPKNIIKDKPCQPGVQPLDGFNCGRGGQRCPSDYYCDIHPADRYAACCPNPALPLCPSSIFSLCAEGPPSGVDLCNSDADCTGTETCCTLCGNRKCEGPSTFNPPVEPPTLPRCSGSFLTVCLQGENGRHMCQSDSDCKGSATCCNSCGLNTCQTPIRWAPPRPVTRPTIPLCPSSLFARCAPFGLGGADHCQSDSDCTGTETCCSLCGNKKCEEPSTFNPPGPVAPPSLPVCRASIAAFCLPGKNGPDDCQSDSDCKGAATCCNFCGSNTCEEPLNAQTVPVAPPTLPRCSGSFLTVCLQGENGRHMCQSDSDCKGSATCCNSCGLNTCQTPIRWAPPRPVTRPTIPLCPSSLFARCAPFGLGGADHCQSDSDCTGTETCCSLCGNKKCEEPSTSNPPGPVAPPSFPACRASFAAFCLPGKNGPDDCQSDSDCKGAATCCNFCGSNTCEEPLPPTLPRCSGSFATVCPQGQINGRHMCQSDSDCRRASATCCNSCGLNICEKPIRWAPPRPVTRPNPFNWFNMMFGGYRPNRS